MSGAPVGGPRKVDPARAEREPESERERQPEPEPVSEALAGAQRWPASANHSDAEVVQAIWPDGRRAYLKSARPGGPGQGTELLRAEHERLVWLAGRAPVPEVVLWIDGDEDSSSRALGPGGTGDDRPSYLLTAALPGAPATADVHRADAEALIRALATGLRAFHDLPVGDCPFGSGLDERLALAGRRVELGLVDQDDFEPAYRTYAPARLFELLAASRPEPPEDLVVVHGDYSLANVQVDGSEVVGYVDVGHCRVADRYVDLAVAARSLAHHVSPEALGPFFDAYGLDLPDLLKVDFYVLLDEFF